jgi:predicted NBD/HSP70 family sugar kinase
LSSIIPDNRYKVKRKTEYLDIKRLSPAGPETMTKNSVLCYTLNMHIAIDIGGTKTLLALFDKRGTRLKRYKMKSFQEPEKFLSELKKNLPRVFPFRRKMIKNVVISYPGILNNGNPEKAPNLPEWDGKIIQSGIKQIFSDFGLDIKIYYKNDADLGGLYECWDYIGKTVYLTFGTGIGGALVNNRRLTRGSNYFEPGHMKKMYR